MKKKFISLFLVLFLLSVPAISAFAADTVYVIDLSERISDDEALNALAGEIYEDYALAVSFAISDSLMGRRSAELAEYLYDSNVGAEDGILLLDCLESDSYYILYRGQGEKLSAQASELCRVYDRADTYDSGVRAYLNAVADVLEAESVPGRDLVLLEDESTNSLNSFNSFGSSSAQSGGNQLTQPSSSDSNGPLLSLDDVSGSGAVSPADNPLIPDDRRYDRVADLAGVTGGIALEELNDMADAVSERYGCDVAVAFVRHVDGADAQSAANDFYDYNGYGYGDDDSGILLYVAVEDREYAMSTYMAGAYVFTDYGLVRLEDAIMPYLRESDWEGTAEAFICECEELLAMADSGTVYDVPQQGAGYSQQSGGVDAGKLGIAALLGLGTGFVPVAAMKGKMKSVRSVKGASNYVRQGSFDLSYSNDIFIRRTVNRVPRPQPKRDGPGGSGGGFSGGSSMHISSSGRSHGGRSGKF